MSSLDARIRAELEAKIRSGEWPPGSRIPTEYELMDQFGCARMTVHKAVSALVAAGLVERRKRAGSFVASPHVQTAVIEIPDIGAVIEARGETYRYELIRGVRTDAAALDAAAALPDFQPRGELLVLDGLHVAQGRPFCLERRLIDLAAAPQAAFVDFARLAPGSWLLDHIPWTQARHRITARQAGAAAATLAIPATAACLQVERWTWRLGEPVTFARQLFPGDRYDLIAEFSPKG